MNIFDPTVKQLQLIMEPCRNIGAYLEQNDNVIRPSSAFDIATQFISFYLDEGVAPFWNHDLAWKEARKHLEVMRDNVIDTKTDSAFAMELHEFEWESPDILALFGRIIARFHSEYEHYLKNRIYGTFGELAVSECLRLMVGPFKHNLCPGSIWTPGIWKSRDREISRLWRTWPWADYYFTQITKTYTELEEPIGGYGVPGGDFGFSHV